MNFWQYMKTAVLGTLFLCAVAVAGGSITLTAPPNLLPAGTTGSNLTLSSTIFSPHGKFTAVDAGVIDAQGRIAGERFLVKGTTAGDGLSLSSDSNRISWSGGLNLDNSSGLRSNNGYNTSGGNFARNSEIWAANTAPTIVACSGTAASITESNGTFSFQFDVGTSCTGESTVVLTFPAATTGWVCSCSITTADRMLVQRTMPNASTTVVTMQNVVISTGANGDLTDSADGACLCHGM